LARQEGNRVARDSRIVANGMAAEKQRGNGRGNQGENATGATARKCGVRTVEVVV